MHASVRGYLSIILTMRVNELLILFVAVVLFAGILPLVVMRLKYGGAVFQTLRDLASNRIKERPFGKGRERNWCPSLRYCPHPFTNWSLNPSFRGADGDYLHTVEGFRKTTAETSIRTFLARYPNAYRIVCVGGSSTYCTGIEQYEKTWPSLLSRKLTGREVTILNFGVGGWNTLQSLIRCIAWLPSIRPNLVILYQVKNDLTPLYHGSRNEEVIDPDYQNVMQQLAACLETSWPRWMMLIPLIGLLEIRRLHKAEGLLDIYGSEKRSSGDGLKRLDPEIVRTVLFRIETIVKLCELLNSKVLYVPEMVRDGPYERPVQFLSNKTIGLLKPYAHVHVFDAGHLLPSGHLYFQDKMHLTPEGCELFAGLLANRIARLWEEEACQAI